MFTLSAEEAVTELADTNVIHGDTPAAETAVVGADATVGPNILVLNDLWRYVPAYFHRMDADQPRSEAGRRLLERRRRQKERKHQQQQQQQNGAVTEAGDIQRGTLPVDELLAYITNSATNDSATTSTTNAATSRRGRRKSKHSTPSFDAVDGRTTSSNAVLDGTSESGGVNVIAATEKEDLQRNNVTASVVTDVDAADFVVVRRDGKHRPERPVQLQTAVLLGSHKHRKATFYDSLDEFSLRGDKVMMAKTTAEQADVDKTAVGERRVSVSLSAQSSQTPLHSTSATIFTKVPSHFDNLHDNQSSSERVRPVTLRYNDVVKGSKPIRQEKPVVAVSTNSSTNCQHTEPYCGPAGDVKCVETGTNSPNTASGNDVGVVTTSVEPVDLPTTTDGDSSARDVLQSAAGRSVEKVSCSTQTCNVDMSRSGNYAAVDDITENDSPPRRPNPVVFVDAKRSKTDNDDVLQGGLSFGMFDDVTSTGSEARDSDKTATRCESVGRTCSDAATSPVQLPCLPSSPPTPEITVAGRCRPITPLCRSTGSSSSAARAPVGIVPPIIHVVTALGDVSLLADQQFVVSTHQQVRCRGSPTCWPQLSLTNPVLSPVASLKRRTLH